MNKSDLKLIITIIIIIGLFMLWTLTLNSNNAKEAVVYYDNDKVLTIDLNNNDTKEYTVQGYNGEVKLEVKEGKIRVIEEISPLHLCSYQGWIDSSYEMIVCLPNKIVIKIEEKKDKIDTIVR